MKNKKNIRLLGCCIVFLIGCHNSGYAQLSSKKKKALILYAEADKFKVRGQYSQAIVLLQEAVKKDKYFVEAYLQLGRIYKSVHAIPQSNETLQRGLTMTRDATKKKEFFFELGENYLRQGDYQTSRDYLTHYLKAKKIPLTKKDQAERWKQNAEYGLEHRQEIPDYQPRELDAVVNRFDLQYYPALTADEQELIFTYRKNSNPDEDEDLVVSKKDHHGVWLTPTSISKRINTKFNEGTCSVSAEGNFLVFTSCGTGQGYGRCDLFFSRKVGGQWSLPVNMGPAINSPEWDSQPALSADGTTLYFTSDRKGGKGGMDIYSSYKKEDGTWSEAKNIGGPINTLYDEISPFIHTTGRVLFFASNGRPGFGGYDIYKSELDKKMWGEPSNFGFPVNDHTDQFSLIVSANGKKGYYAREEYRGRKTFSKLMEVEIPEALQVRYTSCIMRGKVKDKHTRFPLHARIELFDLDTHERLFKTESDSVNGDYLVTLNRDTDYALYVRAPDYLFQSLNIHCSSKEPTSERVHDVYLENMNAGAATLLNNLFFDFDQYILTEKSQIELDHLVAYLKNNAGIKIEIRGHTDDIGSKSYNKQLSLKRAQAVSRYLADKGVNQNRLMEKGYGSDRPLYPNDTEEHRRANRRIEFSITQL